MRKNAIIFLGLFISTCCYTQSISFKKSGLKIKEPLAKDTMVTEKITIILNAKGLNKKVVKAEVDLAKESTYPPLLRKLLTTKIDPLKEENPIELEVTTDPSDKTNFVVIKVSYEDTSGESQLVSDTLYIENTYPFSMKSPYDDKDWKDAKSAEIFIGTNFDLIDTKVTLSDWYGGARVFLPSITDVRFNKNKSNPRFGFAGGIYHARSLSNFGNSSNNDSIRMVYGRISGYVADSAFVRYDTMDTKSKTEINNWGLYFAPLYYLSRFESRDGKFITNIYSGIHMEIIRRNITTSYTFDSIGFAVEKYQIRQIPRRSEFGVPRNYTQTFYDAYYGICVPVQFLWKDILDIKINPCLGIGSRGYTTQVITKAGQQIKKAPFFYLIQFDLLARLGGLRLNIGGEVRGYFPNESPIITSYLGTSFTIQKLVDFVTK